MIMNLTQFPVLSWTYFKILKHTGIIIKYVVLKLINILWTECFSFNFLMVLKLDFILFFEVHSQTQCVCVTDSRLVCFCGIITLLSLLFHRVCMNHVCFSEVCVCFSCLVFVYSTHTKNQLVC